eukprot:73166_1
MGACVSRKNDETAIEKSKRYKHIIINTYVGILKTKQIVPFEIIEMISAFYGEWAKDGILIIPSNQRKELRSDYCYTFHSVVICGVLTVNEWDDRQNKGGKLHIKSLADFVVERGGMINIDGKGYKGGIRAGSAGQSYNRKMDWKKYQGRNVLGGGGGARSEMRETEDESGIFVETGQLGGGGGGYGTIGTAGRGWNKENAWGFNKGKTYGDRWITELHLGSGGGASANRDYWKESEIYKYSTGGDGGGALKIECDRFQNNGQISANGGDGEVNAGGGSGGSIVIECKQFISSNNPRGFIKAVGGYGDVGGYGENGYGNGGFGRIRITSPSKIVFSMDAISPTPMCCYPLV